MSIAARMVMAADREITQPLHIERILACIYATGRLGFINIILGERENTNYNLIIIIFQLIQEYDGHGKKTYSLNVLEVTISI